MKTKATPRTRPILQSAFLFAAAPLLAFAAVKPKPSAPHWTPAWETADAQQDNTRLQLAASETTLRELIQTTRTGPLVRVVLSNQAGTEPLTISTVHLAVSSGQSAILLSSANEMTFHGRTSITIPPGGAATSDPAAMTFQSGATLAVSLLLPSQQLTQLSTHADPAAVAYRVAGDQVGRGTLRSPAIEHAWLFLKSVEVMVPGKNGAVGAFTEEEIASKNPRSTQ